MEHSLAREEIQDFVEKLGRNYPHPVKLYLLGGSALCFLGNPRRTIDIDFSIKEPSEEIRAKIEEIANLMALEVEIIDFHEFIPLPENAEIRHRHVGKFGEIDVYIFDPYSIALSKLARGFDTDIQDVIFLLERDIIRIDTLSIFVKDMLPIAWDYDIDPVEMQKYLEIVRQLRGE